LTWLCFSKRPVKVYEIMEELTVELGKNPRLNGECPWQDPNDLILIFPGLISMSSLDEKAQDGSFDLKEEASFDSDEESHLLNLPSDYMSLSTNEASQVSLVHIAHISVQEYLESERFQSSKVANSALHSREANMSPAATRPVYLQNVPSTDLDGFRLGPYAIEYWHQHLLEADEESDTLISMATDLLNSKDSLNKWISLYNPNKIYPRLPRNLSSMGFAGPLYCASLLGLYRLVEALLEPVSRDGTIAARFGEEGNTLYAASSEWHDKIVHLLLDKGADVDAQEGCWPWVLMLMSTRSSMVLRCTQHRKGVLKNSEIIIG
jgi:hypothetical protein